MWVFQDVLLVPAASVPEQPSAMSCSFAGRLGQVSVLQRGLFCQAHMAGTGTADTGSGDTAGQYVAQSWFTFDKRLAADEPAEAMAYVIARNPVVGAGFTTLAADRDEDAEAVTPDAAAAARSPAAGRAWALWRSSSPWPPSGASGRAGTIS